MLKRKFCAKMAVKGVKCYGLALWTQFEAQKYDIYLSQVTLDEVGECHEPKRTILFEYLSRIFYAKLEMDLREVFRFLQCAEDKDRMKELVKVHEEDYGAIEEDAYDVMAALTNSMELEKLKETCMKKGGKVDMCLAMKEWAAEERMIGRNEGRMEERKNIAYSLYLRGMSQEEISAVCKEDRKQVEKWFQEWKIKGTH